MSDIRALNGPFRVFAPAIQAGFTTRLKTEQAAIRKIVIRMDTMRRTSYVSAGYLIAEVTASCPDARADHHRPRQARADAVPGRADRATCSSTWSG